MPAEEYCTLHISRKSFHPKGMPIWRSLWPVTFFLEAIIDGGKMKKTRILLLDDNSLFRSGVKSLLQNEGGFEIIGEAVNAQEGIEIARDLAPDVILMDITMPDIEGAEAITALLDVAPSTNILVFTFSKDKNDLFDAIKAGARGYILKNEEPINIIRFLKCVASGDAAVSESLTSTIVERFRSLIRHRYENESVLTPREREIIILLAEGMSNREIAMKLCLSERTVKNHIQHLLKKLNLKSRIQAAVYVTTQGWNNRATPYLPKGTTSYSPIFFPKMITMAD